MNPEADAAAFAAEAGEVPTVVVNDTPKTAPAPTFTEAEAPSKSAKFYTEDDLAKVRAQEKDKLYPQIDALKEELAELKREKEERAAAKAAREAEEAAALKAKEEDELSAKDLLLKKEQEWQAQLEAERIEREKAFALLEREKQFADLQAYKSQRIEEVRDNVIPELLDLIAGNTREEVEASIAALTERSSRIIDSVAQASQSARREMVGTRPTLPSTGPLDIETGSRQFTAEDIAAMSMNDYAKYRQQLLSPSAQGRTSGLFG